MGIWGVYALPLLKPHSYIIMNFLHLFSYLVSDRLCGNEAIIGASKLTVLELLFRLITPF